MQFYTFNVLEEKHNCIIRKKTYDHSTRDPHDTYTYIDLQFSLLYKKSNIVQKI